MNTTSMLLVIGLLIAVAVIGWLIWQRQRSTHLKSQFGDEYQRRVEHTGSAAKAEAELAAREKRVAQFDIRDLTTEERERFSGRWTEVKALFVDSPKEAVVQADELLGDVMRTRGYPVSDFNQRTDDLSVQHAHVIDHYRTAHDIAVKQERGEAGTEELRQALQHYEKLFGELVDSSLVHNHDSDGDGVPDSVDRAPANKAAA